MEVLYFNSQENKNSFPQIPFFFALLLFEFRPIFFAGLQIKKVGLEFKFIRAIQKRYSDRTNSEKESIEKRNEFIDSQFEFTPKVCEKIILLNEKLREEEKRIFYQYRKIEEQCKLMVKNKPQLSNEPINFK